MTVLPKPISKSAHSRTASPAKREAIKQAKLRGHAVALAEAAQQALEQTLRAFEKHRQQVFERREAKQR